MALQGSPRWGDAVATAIAGFGIVAGVEITPTNLRDIWRLICTEHETEITTNAVVDPTGIFDTAGLGANQVTGTGKIL